MVVEAPLPPHAARINVTASSKAKYFFILSLSCLFLVCSTRFRAHISPAEGKSGFEISIRLSPTFSTEQFPVFV
jgi:hypothetical protein